MGSRLAAANALEGTMARLTSKERSDIPDDEFAGPGRSFPVEDKDHAEAAILDAPKAEAAGSIDEHQEAVIERKAHAKLDKHPTRVAIRKASNSVAARKSL